MLVVSAWTLAAAAEVDLAAGMGLLLGQRGLTPALLAEVGAYESAPEAGWVRGSRRAGVVLDFAVGAPPGPHGGEQLPLGWYVGREVGSVWLGLSAQPCSPRAGVGTRAGLGIAQWTILHNEGSAVTRTPETVPTGLVALDYTAWWGLVFLRGSATARLELWNAGCPPGAMCEVPWPILDLQTAGALAFQVGTVR